MAEQPDSLVTIEDFVRWGASRFNAARLFFGHGTDNAIDEATHLVLTSLQLKPDFFTNFRQCHLTPIERVSICNLIERRVSERIPLAYLTGCSWFAGLEFIVTPQVLVPRSPIAELVETGFDPWIDSENINRVLDLCTGSGCIGIAAALYLPDAQVDLVDLSISALEVARKNVERHGVSERVRVIESDLFTALTDYQSYDVIVSNPPYLAQTELNILPAEYSKEPRLGLFGGEDGLDLVLKILSQAARYLTENGILILEVGSAAPTLNRRLPKVPFTWLEFERGGEGVLLLTCEQLRAYQINFDQIITT